MKKKVLLTGIIALLILFIVYLKSCAYLPIKGTVVDTETGRPIEGAIVLATWTISTGKYIGLPTSEPYKVIETFTDKNGKFKINAYVINPVSLPFIDKPDLTIYKAGYVCWNNTYIFPGLKHRKDFKWKNNREYPLERFKKEYKYTDHVSFIHMFVPPFTDARDPFERAYRWEEIESQKELGGAL